MPHSVLGLLQRPARTLDILVYLLDKEEAKVSDVRAQLVLAKSTCHAAIQSLAKTGLIFQSEEIVGRRQTIIGLTVKGREVAEHLRPISESLENTVSALRSELQSLEMKERTEAENKRMLEILLACMDEEFTLGGWVEAESYGKRALDIASALGDSASVARALQRMGEVHFGKGIMDKAEGEFGESLLIRTRLGDLSGASENRYFLGVIKEKKGDLQGALKDYQEAGRLAKASEDDVLWARATLGIGRVRANEGKYRESLKEFMASIDVFEKMDEVDELPRAYTCAGSSTFYLDADEAIGWHQKCIEISRRTGDLRMLGHGLSNMAGCFNKKKEPKKALQHLREAARIFKMLDEKDMLVGMNIQMGWAYSLEGKWTEAEHRFLMATDTARKYGFTYGLGDALLNLGLMNIELGRTQEARRQLKEALGIFEGLDNQQKVNRVEEALRTVSQ